MKVLIVFNHPYEKSYCRAILEAVTRGLQKANHKIDLIHLDNDGFDPVMRAKDLKAFITGSNKPDESHKLLDAQVKDYKLRLEEAEHLIFIFPIWWELMPALTKGFIDKLIFPGIAYDFNAKGNRMTKKLNLNGVTMITTMNTPKILYRMVFGNAVKKALLLGTFGKMGYKNRKWINLNMVKFASDEKRKKWLANIETQFSKEVL